MIEKADPKDIQIRELGEYDDFSKLDFTDEESGLDPLHVNEFFHSKKVIEFRNQKLSSVWSVLYKKQLVGCFTLSMFAINTNKLSKGEVVKKAGDIRSYPSVLLGQLGVDKQFRHRRIAYWIGQHFTGLTRKISQKIGCRYIVLQTDQHRVDLYKALHFVQSPKKPNQNGMIWMYRRLENSLK